MINKMPMDDYRKLPGLSNSFLTSFDKAPAYAFTYKEPTDAMSIGTMIHSFVLEPETFNEHYLAIDKMNRASKEYKETAAKNIDKEIIWKEDYAKLERTRDNIYSFKIGLTTIGDYLKSLDTEKEVSIQWLENGLGKKARLDVWHKGHDINIVFDIKKTQDCLDFHWSVKKYKYYRQAAWYLDAVNAERPMPTNEFYFIAIEDTEPFGVKVFNLSDDYIREGRIKNEASVLKYLAWKDAGADRSIIYPDVIETIEKPTYL